MKLVPCASVNIVYSEIMRSEIKCPKFSVVDACVYNQTAKGGMVFGGTADVEVGDKSRGNLWLYTQNSDPYNAP